MNTTSRLTFETSSGSVYEIDQRGKRVRFLSGSRRHKAFPSDRQWRPFVAMDWLEVGYRCVIVFEPPSDTSRGDYVITSSVVDIQGQRAA